MKIENTISNTPVKLYKIIWISQQYRILDKNTHVLTWNVLRVLSHCLAPRVSGIPSSNNALKTLFLVLQAHCPGVKALGLSHWGGMRVAFQVLFLALKSLKNASL